MQWALLVLPLTIEFAVIFVKVIIGWILALWAFSRWEWVMETTIR